MEDLHITVKNIFNTGLKQWGLTYISTNDSDKYSEAQNYLVVSTSLEEAVEMTAWVFEAKDMNFDKDTYFGTEIPKTFEQLAEFNFTQDWHENYHIHPTMNGTSYEGTLSHPFIQQIDPFNIQSYEPTIFINGHIPWPGEEPELNLDFLLEIDNP